MDGLHYEQLGPPPQLADSIECFWRLLLPMAVSPDEIIAAQGQAEILFQFEGQSQVVLPDSNTPFECVTSWLMRPYAFALRAKQLGATSSAMIGVRFSAGGWAAFHHTDTTDNQDYTVMPLHDFYLPYEVRLLEEQLYHALRTPHWTSPLIAFFTRRQIQQTHFERIAFAAKQLRHRSMTIPALANQVNLSERQFGRVFRQIIGLSPKQFSRIARLERILVAPDYNTYALTLEQMALRHGFHDASHLVHEFQELVGMSPVDYFGGYYDLIDQKFREHDRFLQWDSDSMKVSFKP